MPKLPTLEDDFPVARIDIDAEGLDFLIDHLPASDVFTDKLKALRDEAKEYMWVTSR